LAASAEAALTGRLETSPGSGIFQAYYDADQDITWTANANINGLMTWNDANNWAANFTLGGVGGWRLPTVDKNGDGIVVVGTPCGATNCLDNEPLYLIWVLGVGYANPGPFSNIAANEYWSSTPDPNSTELKWEFSMQGVSFGIDHVSQTNAAWAVHDGDPFAVPLPAALPLFASGLGLMGLLGSRRRKRKKAAAAA
jgi:hypothetical protein